MVCCTVCMVWCMVYGVWCMVPHVLVVCMCIYIHYVFDKHACPSKALIYKFSSVYYMPTVNLKQTFHYTLLLPQPH
ncbi:hypothetical protein EON63_15195 [archaeon]|nr:MAG: hypothetical protein EON63_15195 [archaeon]